MCKWDYQIHHFMVMNKVLYMIELAVSSIMNNVLLSNHDMLCFCTIEHSGQTETFDYAE